MTYLRLIIIISIIPSIVFSQMGFSGSITPSAMFRLSDGSIIDLPFRFGELELSYGKGDFELKLSTALEYRWENPEYSSDMFQLREAYLSWFPAFGEVRIGKMIQAWGTADGNNPTDNLSPYDFYYMFLPGTDRKLGTLTASMTTYLGDWQADLTLIPEHVPNRLPYDEADFPIPMPPEPDTDLIETIEDPLQYGVRIQKAFGIGDISFSYFNGYDQMFDLIALTPPLPYSQYFGYRDTDVFGFDFVIFPGNWTLRGESAYFITINSYTDPSAVIFTKEAEYIQYVLQAEYELANQITLSGQYIGTHIAKAEGITVEMQEDGTPRFIKLTTENFHPGMGTPFAMISDQIFMFSTMTTLLDNAMELSGMFMINMEETGYMLNLSSVYSFSENVDLEGNLSYFIGDDEDPLNSFSQLEDFSNITIGVAYNF